MTNSSVLGGLRLVMVNTTRLAAVLAVTAVASCAGDALPDGELSAVEDVPAERAERAERAGDRVTFDVEPYRPTAAATADTRDGVVLPLELRSREELADALRPVVLMRDGELYVMSEPNWAAADAVDRVALAAERADGDTAELPLPGGFEMGEPAPETFTAPRIIGSDGRSVVTNTTAAPFRNMARVLITNNDGSVSQCSGSYVGPWTFVLAGHCLRQPSGALARRIVFEPARNGGTLPFGSFDCRNDDGNSSNDFLAAIPAGYIPSADPAFDFAVIDTWPCHSAPRWFGQPASNQGVVVNSGNTTYSMHGYPGNRCPGASSGNRFLCGMSGPAYVNGSWIETEHIDTEPGQSGGPWYVGGRVAATHIGYREYFDLFRCGFDVCRRNFGRRIDGTFKSFLDAIAFDYP